MRFKLTPESMPFKSIPAGFDTGYLPDFTVLTGPNGCGKTQLLEMIAGPILDTRFHKRHRGVKTDFDFRCETHECVLVPWNVTLADAGMLNPSFKTELAQQIKNQKANSDICRIVRTAMGAEFDGLHLKRLEEIVDELPIEAIVSSLEYSHASAQLARLALDHMTRVANLARRSDLKWTDAEEEVGKEHPDPIKEVNEKLDAARVAFRIRGPENFDVSYSLMASIDGNLIPTSQLSSGEQTILNTVLVSLFAGRDRPPKLLILDEADAHLHPSQIPGLLTVLQELSETDSRVILATHRSETISLAPEASLYLKRNLSLDKCGRSEALGAVAGFVVEAMKTARLVYVEDRADQEFYVAVDGLRKKTVGTQPTLVFQPIYAGVAGANSAGGGGGCQAIVDRVEELRPGSMGGLVRGLIDKDIGNDSASDIFVLCRYSIENFLFDPLVVYMESVKASSPIPVPDSLKVGGANHEPLTPGQLPHLKELPLQHLQDIASAVTKALETELKAEHSNATTAGKTRPPFNTATTKVTYNSNTFSLTVPDWQLTARGKDFYPAAKRAFGRRPRKDDLAFLFQAIQMLPDDLDTFMSNIV